MALFWAINLDDELVQKGRKQQKMDYYEPRDDLDALPVKATELSPIQSLFEGKYIFITGASGFMGKVLLEKLLRTCNVAQIYILVRDKKGTKSQDRLKTLLEDVFFEPLKLQKPGEVRKVRIVAGDCSSPGLGLSDEDRQMLSQVNIIFHAAATLTMDQHLKTAYITNVQATQFLLEFATTLAHLKAFMYVSTAYTHAYRDLVDETFYSVVFDEEEIKHVCTELDDAQVGALTPKLIGRWGNTYALTKAVAENLISKYDGILPVGVVRPSIVVSVWAEPLQGWINNVYGAVGVVMGTALGLLRFWCADPNMVADMIPVDTAINMTIAATWEVATKNTQLKIYNLVTSTKNPITYDILRTANEQHGKEEQIYTVFSIAPCDFFLVKSKFLFSIVSIWYHAIPALFMDFFLSLTGKVPQLVKVYTKVLNVNKMLMPYCVEKHISFKSDNVDKLWRTLHPLDKKLFNLDLTTMSWRGFWLQALKGMRVYLLKDPMETVPKGVVHYRRLVLRKLAFDTLIRLFFGWLAYLFIKKYLPITSLW